MEDRTAQEIRAHLRLPPNTDEKGYLAQTFRDGTADNGRGASTAAYYILEGSAGPSTWHRVDTAEVWHYYAGAPITLAVWTGEGSVGEVVLGPDLFAGQRPQVVVRAGEWQSARCEGDWTLSGTTGKDAVHWAWIGWSDYLLRLLVAPGFVDSSIEFAESGWEPPGR